MTCAKQRVIATVVAADGTYYTGENLCNNPQKVCPRDELGYKSGEGYELCKSICDQQSHAEVVAITKAGDNAKGATLYLRGHSYACGNCKSCAEINGIEEIVVCND